MTGENSLAARTVRGVVAGMVTATAAATIVGFWLSYAGLHTFARRAGLTGPESWAWPASVDLFIAAGEAGVTISALRRHKDPLAWCYLALGFAMSVAGNVLHVATGHLPWARYAVAAVPPMAALLALAALLRHIYQLALEAHLEQPAEPAPKPGCEAVAKARPRTTRKARGRGVDAATRAAIEAARRGQPVPSARTLARAHHIGRDKATQVRAAVLAEADGHGQPGQLTTT